MGTMTPWERLEREMRRKRKSVHDLAQATGASISAIWHWQHRGIPARHLRAAADFVGRPVDWLELGLDPSPDILVACQTISAHLESLGEYDRQTVVSLLSTLAHSPQLFEVVATGLEALPKQKN
ncbi:Cro/C1-type helix-turn-helix domain [Comamonadaceae bacterium]